MEVVFDDNHRVAARDKLVENFKETLYIVGMKASRRFIEDIEGFPGAATGEFGRELYTLGLATREGRCGLAKTDVAKTDFLERYEFVVNCGDILEKFASVVDCHVEDFRDVFALVFNFESFAVVATAVAGRTSDVDVGEEVHFDFVYAIALASFATSAFDVKGETAGFIATDLGFGLSGEKVTNGSEDAGIGRGVRTRSAADWGLVDEDDFVEELDALDTVMKAGDGLGMV